jgi:cytochrome d ubiquinol oxidase subunit II
VIVVMFSAFPRAFAVLGIALHIPIALSLVGIVLRGAAFSFHAYGLEPEHARERWAQLFAWSSSLTPVFLGLVVGGVSTGRIRVDGSSVTSGWFAGWTTPFALLVSLFTLALFAMLSAVYLAAETSDALGEDFRRRALICELVAGGFAAIVFVRAHQDAPRLFQNFVSSIWFVPVQVGTALLAGLTLYALWRRRPRIARYTAAGQVALVVIGWGLGMDHHFVLPDVSITNAGARPEVLPALVVTLGIGGAVLAPALYYLYRIFKLQKRS